MNKKFALIEIVLLGLAVVAYIFTRAGLYSQILGTLFPRSLCSTGCTGDVCTMGLVSCFASADRYGIYLTWVFVGLAVLCAIYFFMRDKNNP